MRTFLLSVYSVFLIFVLLMFIFKPHSFAYFINFVLSVFVYLIFHYKTKQRHRRNPNLPNALHKPIQFFLLPSPIIVSFMTYFIRTSNERGDRIPYYSTVLQKFISEPTVYIHSTFTSSMYFFFSAKHRT